MHTQAVWLQCSDSCTLSRLPLRTKSYTKSSVQNKSKKAEELLFVWSEESWPSLSPFLLSLLKPLPLSLKCEAPQGHGLETINLIQLAQW